VEPVVEEEGSVVVEESVVEEEPVVESPIGGYGLQFPFSQMVVMVFAGIPTRTVTVAPEDARPSGAHSATQSTHANTHAPRRFLGKKKREARRARRMEPGTAVRGAAEVVGTFDPSEARLSVMLLPLLESVE
jgi:hypothetical protein